jgi:glycine oxidase
MLAVEDPENPAALQPFSRYSRALYPSFLEQIEALCGSRVPFRTHQTIQIADQARPPSAGTPLSRDEALRLVPGLADGDHTYLLLEEASLDPRELCTALRTAAAAAGVAIYEHEPVRSAAAAGESTLVTTPRRELHADAFVNCCGAWAASLHASAAVAPSKGQMLVVAQPGGSRLTRVLRSPEVYLIPRDPFSNDNGRIVIGATVEDVGYSKLVEPAALSLLRRRAAALWPPAADALEIESWAGLRPGTPDGLPFLGQVSGDDRDAPHFLAAGHHRNGILLAPGTAHVIADLISGRTPAIDLAPFSPHRASPSTACDKHFAAAL